MKKLTMKTMFAAAAFLALSASASAETLRADIPFAFRAGETLMKPGAYEFRSTRAAFVYKVTNRDDKSSVLLQNFRKQEPSKVWMEKGEAKVAFDCAGSDCVLREMWTGGMSQALRFSGAAPGGDRHDRKEIKLTSQPD